MGTAPWSSVKQNETGPESGQRCSSSSAGSQPGTVCLSRRAKNASDTPSAATSRSSPSDSIVSTSLRRDALHGAASASSAFTLGARWLGGAERAMNRRRGGGDRGEMAPAVGAVWSASVLCGIVWNFSEQVEL